MRTVAIIGGKKVEFLAVPEKVNLQSEYLLWRVIEDNKKSFGEFLKSNHYDVQDSAIVETFSIYQHNSPSKS